MNLRKVHYLSGITITIFVILHLFNHLYSLFGASAHIQLMTDLRVVYRNWFAESILLFAVAVQIYSGIKLFFKQGKHAKTFFKKLQLWSGLYLAVFLLIHLSAVFVGRLVLDLDTNFYFGVAGINTFPFNLFFFPYYGLAIVSFFGHIAGIHRQKMRTSFFSITPEIQSYFILFTGVALTIVTMYGLTNGFVGVEIPEAYNVLIGK